MPSLLNKIRFFLFFILYFGSISFSISADRPVMDKKVAYSLIYETVITVNNATATGNYSVLHAKGSQDFQSRYQIEDLKKILSGLKKKNVDLKPVVLLKPEIVKSEYRPSKKIFRLKGHMPTRPVQMNFDFYYKHSGGEWRIYALNLDFAKPLTTGGVDGR